jgi:AbrB family looped-hinge helix DNA binding protein
LCDDARAGGGAGMRKSQGKKTIYGVATVSDKGQIAIPVELRNDLGIKRGDQLLVIRQSDDSGLVLMKLDRVEDLLSGIRHM